MATTTTEVEEGRIAAVPALAAGPAGRPARRLIMMLTNPVGRETIVSPLVRPQA